MFNEKAVDIGPTNWRFAKSTETSSSKRGAKACWENLLRNQYEQLACKVYKANHCLLHTGAIQLRGGVNRSKMRTNELSGYVHVSFGSEPKGADTDKHKQKHRPFHCIIWLLYHPDDIVTFEEANNDHHVSHFCHRGICANVWDHLDLVPEKFNLSQNGCIFGSAVTCPHRPKRCIFVDIRGNPLPCLNNPQTVSSNCIHDPNCFKSRLLPGVAETGVITIEGTQRKRKQPAETANEEKN
jgi:hypothetical protein